MQRNDKFHGIHVKTLFAFVADKDLYVCKTALQDFHTILDTVGGPRERERARQLLDKVTVVQDQTSARAQGLAVSAKIKDRAKVSKWTQPE